MSLSLPPFELTPPPGARPPAALPLELTPPPPAHPELDIPPGRTVQPHPELPGFSRQDTKLRSDILPQRVSPADDAKRRARRSDRYRLRETLWNLSSLDRCRACGRIPARGAQKGQPQTPELRLADGVAHYAGVARCGSVHACPVCGPRIRQERATEVEAGMTAWLERYGSGSVLFLTLTVPHDDGEPLGELMHTIKAAWRRIFSGRRWQEDKAAFGAGHYVRAWDATHGMNGWHPHLHAVLFTDRVLTPDELRGLEDRVYERWAGAVEDRGRRRPTREHGVRLEQARGAEDLAAYVMKITVSENDAVALELARGDLKTSRTGHRTPWRILADFTASGDDADLELWHEWESATHGTHFTQWSRGLRKLLNIEARTDAEIVNEEIGGETVHRFTPEEWFAVCAARGALADLLELAERGGEIAVRPRVRELLEVWRRKRRRRARLAAA